MSLHTLCRGLFRSPGFTAAAAATLALGIGANTAVFSVVEAALLRPLPYAGAERLVSLKAVSRGIQSGAVAVPEFLTWRAQSRTLADMAGFRTREFNLTGVALPERLAGVQVTAGLLPMLGVEPASGRGFLGEEGRPGGTASVILSDALSRRLGKAPGSAVVLDGTPYNIVGVLPEKFRFPDDGPVDLLTAYPLPDAPDWDASGFQMLTVIGRLRPGVEIEAVRAELMSISRGVTAILRRMFPMVREGLQIRVVTLREALTGAAPHLLMVLTGAVAFVLLIACVNVAHLSLARSAARRKQIGLRHALGASRARLVRHLLGEGLLLALLGAAAGLAVASAALRLVRAFAPPAMPYLQRTELNPAVLVFTILLASASVLLFGLGPAMAGTRVDLNEVLKDTGPATGRQRFRFLLITAEVALALVLAIGAGLLLRSYAALNAVDPGFRPDHVLTVRLRLPRADFAERWRYAAFVRQVEDRLRSLPGVRFAGAVTSLPLTGFALRANVTVTEGGATPSNRSMILEQGPGESSNTPINSVTPDYFRTMTIPLLAGRPFDRGDTASAARVAIINQSFARKYFSKSDPFRERVAGARIVGIVGDARHLGLNRDSVPEVFVPFDQSPLSEFAMVVKTAGNPLALAGAVRAAVAAVDRNQAVYDIATMEGRLAESLAVQRFQTTALSIFAGLALLLAALGVYAVMAYCAVQRTHEMGVRMALGASPGDVLWMVLRQAMAAVLAGTAVGASGALALARVLGAYLYGIPPTDAPTFAAASVAVILVAFLAVSVPAARTARRAAAIECLRAL